MAKRKANLAATIATSGVEANDAPAPGARARTAPREARGGAIAS